MPGQASVASELEESGVCWRKGAVTTKASLAIVFEAEPDTRHKRLHYEEFEKMSAPMDDAD